LIESPAFQKGPFPGWKWAFLDFFVSSCRCRAPLGKKSGTMKDFRFTWLEGSPMTKTERDIMRHFRQYHIGVNEMLCFNTTMANSNSPKFQSAMTALIRTGMVVKERHRHAYSLTPDGFTLSMSA
jgi:hypothetical protein